MIPNVPAEQNTLKLISQISKILLRKGETHKILEETLSMLGAYFDIDRVYVFKNRIANNGIRYTSYYVEWVAKDVEAYLDNEKLSEVSYKDFLPNVQNALENGNNVSGKVKNFSSFERSLLEMQGIKSILVVPIIFEGLFWGFVGFDDCKDEREWSYTEIETLTLSANMLSGYIIRNNIQENLVESEQRWYTALKGSNEGVWDFDTQAGTVYLSDEGKRILGIANSEKHNIHVREILGGLNTEYRASARKFMNDMSLNADSKIEFEFKREINNEIRWFRIKGAVVAKNALEKPSRIIGTFADTTNRKMSELRLIEALTAAESANKAKSSFLATMSHEIRTPLNGMVGFLKLLFEHVHDETGKEYLKIIDNSADSLMNIINSILDLSKVESGNMVLESLDTNLPEELETIAKLFSASAYEKGLHLASFIDPLLPTIVKCDKMRIRQVLSNLLNNAMKFTAKGGFINLLVIVTSKRDGRVRIKFSVADNGIGIDKESQKAIFKPFIQADSSIARKFGGSGLGLTIAYKFVELMDSSLQLESNVGKGAAFSFELELPFVKDAPQLKSYVQRIASISLPKLPWDNSDMYARFAEKHTPFYDAASLCAANASFDIIIFSTFFSNQSIIDSLQLIRNKFPDTPIALITYHIDVSVFDVLNKMNVKVKVRPLLITKLVTFLNNLNSGNLPQIDYDDYTSVLLFTGRVLIVEDNPINSKLITIILERYGLNVTSAANGAEALAKFDNNNFDMILMDVNMPVMDGMTATREIRKRENDKQLRHTPIYALTANVMKGDANECINAGMDGVLGKPIETADLENVMKAHLKHV